MYTLMKIAPVMCKFEIIKNVTINKTAIRVLSSGQFVNMDIYVFDLDYFMFLPYGSPQY